MRLTKFLSHLIAAGLLLAAPAGRQAQGADGFDLGAQADKSTTPSPTPQTVGTRTRIPIGGDWLVQPVSGSVDKSSPEKWPDSLAPAPDQWVTVQMPGDWRAVLQPKKIAGKGTAEVTPAWLVKEVRLPTRMPGQRVLLALDAVWGGIAQMESKKTNAEPRLQASHVYVNGQYAGNLTGWQRQRLDVTALVRGDRMQVAILNGTPGESDWIRTVRAKVEMEASPLGIFKTPFVEITAAPTPVFVDDVLVTPDVRNHKLKVTLAAVARAPQKIRCVARLYDVPMFEARKTWPPDPLANMKAEDWQPDPSTTTTATPVMEMPPQEITIAKGRTDVDLQFPSGNLECWSPANPRLYWLSIQLQDSSGKVLDTSVPVTFGFREIWTDGPDILLNGMKINIFGSSHNYYGDYVWTPVDLACKHQLGLVMDRTQSTWRRACREADDAPLLADRWGHFFSIDPKFPLPLGRYLHNHPSLIMWQFGGNGYVNGPHSHPLQVGGAQNPPAPDSPRKAELKPVKELVDKTRAADSSRPSFFYRLGYGGEIRSLMGYVDVNDAMMDLREWFLEYSHNAVQRKIEPFMGSELSFTLAIAGMHYWTAPAKCMAGRNGLVENAARLLGDEAYSLVTAEEMLPQAMENPMLFIRGGQPLSLRLYQYAYEMIIPPWRASGISALYHIDGKPGEHFSDMNQGILNERGRAFQRENNPLMAWIAGPGEDFTALDHAYRAGEPMEKQILLFNDTYRTEPVKMHVEVEAQLDGKTVFTKTTEMTVENGRRASVPVSFTLPTVITRQEGILQARVTADGLPVEVRPFRFQVFPSKGNTPTKGGSITLMDPVGDTAKMLGKAGVTFTATTPDADFSDATLVIIGRNAIGKDWGKKLNVTALTRLLGKGGNVIVFEQQERKVGGLTNEHFNERQAWIRDPASPLLKGFTNEDFAYWRGSSNILEPRQSFDRTGFDWVAPAAGSAKHGLPNNWGQTRRFAPQWSNRNMLATYCYQKPQAGNFHILLESGFDHLFTPLVEFQAGGGRILFCQLDVTNRYGDDPVLTLLVDRMLHQYRQPAERPTRKVCVLGDAATQALVQKAGFPPEPADGDLKPTSQVVVLQPGITTAKDLTRVVNFTKAGGTCIVLGAFDKADLAPLKAAGLIGFDGALDTVDAVSLKDPPPALTGLGASDFYYRRFMPGLLANEGTPGWRGAGGLVHAAPLGKGQVIYCAVRPETFAEEWQGSPQAWQKTEVEWPTSKFNRILATLLTNAGANSSVTPHLVSNQRSTAIYPYIALDFDPMESHTW